MDSSLLNSVYFKEGGFENIIISQEDSDSVKLRTNAKARDQFEKWLELYCLTTNTRFNSAKLYPVGEKKKFRQLLMCQHGCRYQQGKRKSYTGCRVRMDVTIRKVHRDSARRDPMMPSYPCFITICGVHNHSTSSADALRQLRVLPGTKDIFEKYFHIGMTAGQASRYHQEKLHLNLVDMASNSINPPQRAVQHLQEIWRRKQHGSVGGESMFAQIRKYAEANPDTTIEAKVDGDNFAIVLVTAFMFRVHENIREACEGVFVDTTSHVDQLNIAVTPLLCGGPSGALPLGMIFTSSQDEKSYVTGFQLLQKVLGKSAFNGQGHPNCFITDNSEAARKALRTVWPDSRLFLCVFHVLQQVWRWLCNGSHGIKKEHRPELMQVARKLVYAESDVTLENFWNTFSQSPEAHQYNQYKSYLENLMERKQEWSLLFRAGNILRGNHTNNYAESTMCIIKDVILNRCKAHNTCQLIMFMNEIYDGYMKQRLLDVALSRKKLKTFMKPSIPAENITKIDDCKFTVLSENNKDVHYNVDLSTGMCDCVSGQTGSVCKHQIACGETAMMNLPQVLENTAENRQWLAGVANGTENLPSLDLFSVKIEIGPEIRDNASLTAVLVSGCNIPVGPSVKETVLACTTTQENVSSDAIEQTENSIKREAPTQEVMVAATDRFYNCLQKLGDGSTDQTLRMMVRAIDSMKTTNQLHSSIHAFVSSSKSGVPKHFQMLPHLVLLPIQCNPKSFSI